MTTPKVSPSSATVRIETTIENSTAASVKYSLQSEIIAPDGTVAATFNTSGKVAREAKQSVTQQVALPNPRLWTLDAPQLYTLRTRVNIGLNVVDETTTPFGIRTFAFDPASFRII